MVATAQAVPGLWPFILPVFFTILEDAEAGIYSDQFSDAPPKGMGLAEVLVAHNAPLNLRALNVHTESPRDQRGPSRETTKINQVRPMSKFSENFPACIDSSDN